MRNLMQITKLSLFFFLALIVFDFYSFEGSKTHFTGEAFIRRHYRIYRRLYDVIIENFIENDQVYRKNNKIK